MEKYHEKHNIPIHQVLKKVLDKLSGVQYGSYNTKLRKVLYGETVGDEINLFDYLDQHGDSEFIVMKPHQVEKYKAGTCWDTSLYLYHELAELGYEDQTSLFFYVIKEGNKQITHSTIIVKDDQDLYNVEYSRNSRRGVWKLKSYDDLYIGVKERPVVFFNEHVNARKLLNMKEIRTGDFIRLSGWKPELNVSQSMKEGVNQEMFTENMTLSKHYNLIKNHVPNPTQGVNQKLISYIEKNILPYYDTFDKGHDIRHANGVINLGMAIIRDPSLSEENLNTDMVYTICAYHDIGISVDRENHGIHSSKMFRKDKFILATFTPEQIKIMAEAIEDHRSEFIGKRRNIYGKVLADADRESAYDPVRAVDRLWGYRLKHMAHMTDKERFDDMIEYIDYLYSPGQKYYETELNISFLKELMNSTVVILKSRNEVQRILMELGYIDTPFYEAVNNVSIKEVTVKDVKSSYMMNWFFRMGDNTGVDPRTFDFTQIATDHKRKTYTYGYFLHNRLEGIISIFKRDKDYRISKFYVNSNIQGKGVGGKLFKYVMNMYKGNPISLQVEVENKIARSLYRKFGFKEAGSSGQKGGDGRPMIEMKYIPTQNLKESEDFITEAFNYYKDISCYNISNWDGKKYPALLVAGFCGSGKTTLANKLGKEHDCPVYSLDRYGDVMEEEIGKDEVDKLKVNRTEFQSYQIQHIIQKHKGERVVIEGIRPQHFDKERHKQYPLIIMGMSFWRSIFSVIGREFTLENYKRYKTIKPIPIKLIKINYGYRPYLDGLKDYMSNNAKISNSREIILEETMFYEKRPSFMILKINNSKKASVDGKWGNPGAGLYDQLLQASYMGSKIPETGKDLDEAMKADGSYLGWTDYLKETYLVAPVSQIKNTPHGVTPFSKSGCKYPHHVIRGKELVLHRSGVRAAFRRACQQGVYKGQIREHIKKHYKELGLVVYGDDDYWEEKSNWIVEDILESNFEYLEDYISENLQEENEDYESVNESQYDLELPDQSMIQIRESMNEINSLLSISDIPSDVFYAEANWKHILAGAALLGGGLYAAHIIWKILNKKKTISNAMSLSHQIDNPPPTPSVKIPQGSLTDVIQLTSTIKYALIGTSINLVSGIGDKARMESSQEFTEADFDWKKEKLFSAQTRNIKNLDAIKEACRSFGRKFNVTVYGDIFGKTGELVAFVINPTDFLRLGKDLLRKQLLELMYQGTDPKKHIMVIGKPVLERHGERETTFKRTLAHEYGHILTVPSMPENIYKESKLRVSFLETLRNSFREHNDRCAFIWSYYHTAVEKLANDAVGIVGPDEIALLGGVPASSYSTWKQSLFGKFMDIPIPADIVQMTDIPPNKLTAKHISRSSQFSVEVYKQILPTSHPDKNKILSFLQELTKPTIAQLLINHFNKRGMLKTQAEGTDKMIKHNDDLDWMESFLMEEGEDVNPSQQKPEEPKPTSLPKQRDQEESDKNGVRRKKLYIAFIEWSKEFNPKNTFGSVFDKDVFGSTYPFVPQEMRYFYRLANPMLCVLGGDLTFFALAELRKVNMKNSRLNEMMIFAATPNDLRIFNVKDKKVYLGTEENGMIKLGDALGGTFDTYLQNMIKKGDILNSVI